MTLFLLSLTEDKYKYEQCHAGTQQHHSGKHTRPILISVILLSFSSFNQIVEVWIHIMMHSYYIWQNATTTCSERFKQLSTQRIYGRAYTGVHKLDLKRTLLYSFWNACYISYFSIKGFLCQLCTHF